MTIELPKPPLLVITDRRQARRPLADVVAAALDGGCRWVSLREKDLPQEEQILLMRSFKSMMHARGGKFMLHGDAAVAKQAGADGVHLASEADAAAGRALIGAGKLVGVSIHTVTEAEEVDPIVVDYALAGPAFETASKPGYGPEIGRKGLFEIARLARVPVLAIGGINASRVGEIIAAGAVGIAVMGGIMRAADPAKEVSALIGALQGSLALRA